jgi:hypothetical protein
MAFLQPAPAPAQTAISAPALVTWDDACVTDVSADRSSLEVAMSGQRLTLVVKPQELRSTLARFGRGDRAKLQYAPSPDGNVLKAIAVKSYPVSNGGRIGVMAVTAAALAALTFFLLGRNPMALIRGVDNRYSNSQFQVAVWFFLLVAVYVAATVLRIGHGGAEFAGGVNIPQNVLLLSGFSALTFAAAKGITQGQLAAQRITKSAAPAAKFPTDLFCDDAGRVDMGKFQMVILTFLAVGVYVVQVFDFLRVVELHKQVTLPDVDTTILAAFGLGQGAYLTKKYVDA